MSVLAWLLIIPIAGALFSASAPHRLQSRLPYIALGFTGAAFILAASCAVAFTTGKAGLQYMGFLPWLPGSGININLGADGFGILLLLSSGLIFTAGTIAQLHLQYRSREYFFWWFLLQACSYGVFCSQDLFVLLSFLTLTLLACYFLCALWGGENSKAAADSYFTAGLFFTLPAFAAAIWLMQSSGTHTFALDKISAAHHLIDPEVQFWALGAFFAAAAFRLPLFPFHGWTRNLLAGAPVAVAAAIAGVLAPAGMYLLVKVTPLVPFAAKECKEIIIALAVINIIYGALLMLAKKAPRQAPSHFSMVAMGFGAATAAAGTVSAFTATGLAMFSGGITAASLFIAEGLAEKYAAMKGRAPFIHVFSATSVLASAGMPLLCMFPVYLTGMLAIFSGNIFYGVAILIAMAFAAGLGIKNIKPAEDLSASAPPADISDIVLCALLTAALVLPGITPDTFVSAVSSSAQTLAQALK